ncbi:Uncharacterised protein [Bordetella pertussis]|nr:Uncharacterised protein [Bordetella pertussis]
MTPGRSLLAKTQGRSMAPAASTTCFACTYQSRCVAPWGLVGVSHCWASATVSWS